MAATKRKESAIEKYVSKYNKRIIITFSLIVLPISIVTATLLFYAKNYLPVISALSTMLFSAIAILLARKNKVRLAAYFLTYSTHFLLIFMDFFIYMGNGDAKTVLVTGTIHTAVIVLAGMLLGRGSIIFMLLTASATSIGIALHSKDPFVLQKLPSLISPMYVSALVVFFFIHIQKNLESKLKERNNELRHEKHILNETLRELEYAKEETERALDTKRDMLSVMGHELRTPLHNILSFTKLAQKNIEKKSKDDIITYLDKVLIMGDKLLTTINDLLELSRTEARAKNYKFQKWDILELINQTKDEFYSLLSERSIDVIIENIYEDEDKYAFVSDEAIKQVMRNIIANSIKFSNDESEIRITVDTIKVPGYNKAEEYLRVIVSDSGIGIPEDELELIFERFKQSSKSEKKYEGSGLGLSIIKEIMKAHNGTIWASNNRNGGADFTFMLPKRTKGTSVAV